MDLQEDPGFLALTAKIARDKGFGCASYKEKCLRRRIAVRMRARGVHTYGDYARVLDADSSEYERLLDALTINVTKLFRNWDVYAAIAEKVIPALWAQRGTQINVWSAGCSSGEEAYSLAVLFHRYASAHHQLGELYARVRIVGTDIDARCLVAAQTGNFQEGDFADTPEELRRRYFDDDPPFTIHPDVRRLVRFERRDLLADAPPAGVQHLICCRNVLIYFDRPTQEQLFDKFASVLAPEGFLVLGKVETLLGPARTKFVAVSGRERVFRPL